MDQGRPAIRCIGLCSPPRSRRPKPSSIFMLTIVRRTIVGGLLLTTGAGCRTVQEFRAQWRVHRGDRLLARHDDLEAALLEFQKAAELAPQLAVAHSRLGVVYRRMGDDEQAIDSFVEAVRRDPFSFQDTFQLAQLYHATHRLVEALQAYHHAAEIKPNDFEVQLNLGTCYQEMGDWQQAVSRFQKAIELDPNRPYAYVNLGVALDAEKKYYEAIRAYRAALERDGEQPMVLVNLAHTYMNQDRLKMARHSLEQAIRMDPQLAVAHEALGYCLFREREWDAAQRSYLAALAYQDRLPRAHAGLGSIHMMRYLEDKTIGEARDRALEHWHRSLELNPDQPRIRTLIAKYTPQTGDPEEVLLDEHSSR